MNVALAADYDTDAILTLDRRDFGRYDRWAATRRSAYCLTTSRSDRRFSAAKCLRPQGTCVSSVRAPRGSSGAVRDGWAECSDRPSLPMVDVTSQSPPSGNVIRVQGCHQNAETAYQYTSPRPLTWGFKKSG